MFPAIFLALVPTAPVAKDPPSPWRADPPPAGFRADHLNDGLPLRWEKGTVHVLAWATVTNDYPQQSATTQSVVIKQFDRPTENGGHRWVLALLYLNPKDPKRPWSGPMIHYGPPLPGDPPLHLTDAQQWAYEFYADRPTDEEVVKFLGECGWDPRLGTEKTLLSNGDKVNITRTLSAGGADPVMWRKVFEREMPPRVFPELRKVERKK
jgi:hypothetical protein